MAIKKYFANKDNTITSAFRADLRTRGTGSNMGLSDVLETFSIYGQASGNSTELERILIQFPIEDIRQDRTAGNIPDSGEVSFYLNMYNAEHSQTTPREAKLVVLPISSSWEEGIGLDMSEYKDTTDNGEGSNWINSAAGTPWNRKGGDYLSSPAYSQTFPLGNENLQINITNLVEQWLDNTIPNYGVGVHLTSSQEAYYSGSAGQDSSAGELNNLSGSKTSYYTKKFFGRGSEFFYKRPTIEARWDNSIKDDRGDIHNESILLPDSDNRNTIYLYNSHGGKLIDIPGAGTGASAMMVKFFDSESSSTGEVTGTTPTMVMADRVSKGIYAASFIINTTASIVYDRWFNPTQTECYHTGSFYIRERKAEGYNPYPNYVVSLQNLRPIYYSHETARFRFYIRQKDWSPTIYTVATTETDTLTMQSSSYQIHRLTDDMIVVPFDTSTDNSTMMSYDISGNYLDFSMNLLEPGYSYGLKVAFYDDSVGSYVEQTPVWKFRVENLESQ